MPTERIVGECASDLDRVVDHPEVQLHAVDLAGHSHVPKRALTADVLDQRGVALAPEKSAARSLIIVRTHLVVEFRHLVPCFRHWAGKMPELAMGASAKQCPLCLQ